MPGFKTHEVTGIVLQGGDSRTVRTIALELATVAETVSVSAEVALTPLELGEKAATLTGEEIRTMPVLTTQVCSLPQPDRAVVENSALAGLERQTLQLLGRDLSSCSGGYKILEPASSSFFLGSPPSSQTGTQQRCRFMPKCVLN